MRIAPFLGECELNPCKHPVPVVWVKPFGHRFKGRNTQRRIKPPDAVSLLRKIEDLRFVGGRRTAVTEPLCFGQMGFAAAQLVFGLLGFIDVDQDAVPT